ncbi:Uncharacterised protein [uncultured archaeon]|nr:Uncharacterised protein [uncultured archaeon]
MDVPAYLAPDDCGLGAPETRCNEHGIHMHLACDYGLGASHHEFQVRACYFKPELFLDSLNIRYINFRKDHYCIYLLHSRINLFLYPAVLGAA